MYCSVAVLDGKLYAVGGLDGTTTLDVVEVYDPQRNAWEESAPKLENRVCGCGLAVTDCVVLPNSELEKEKGLGKMGGAGETTTMEVAAAGGGGGGGAAAGAPGAAVVAAPGGGGGGLATAATTVTASAGAGAGAGTVGAAGAAAPVTND